MSAIKKITVVLTVEGVETPLHASLGFEGFEPNEHDVLRLYGVLKEKTSEPKFAVKGDSKSEGVDAKAQGGQLDK